MYSRQIETMVLLGLVVSFGVVSTVSLMDSQGSSIPRNAFAPSNEYKLQFSTFLGGTDYDIITNMAIDANGCIYLVGTTWSTDLPTTEDSFCPTHSGGEEWEMDDAFVMKLSSDGQEIIYATYLGGSKPDHGVDIEVDDSGCAYVFGRTTSPDFPTVNAYDSSYNGGEDCYVAKLSANGSNLLFSTFIGGAGDEHPSAIAIDSDGNSIIVGITASSDFPVSTTNTHPGFLSLGGSEDGFVCKLSSDGSELDYSMYLGGTETTDEARGIAIDANGDIVIVGSTGSTDFPIANAYDDTLDGIWDSFIMKLNASGHLIFSTYYGGDQIDYSSAVSIDTTGQIYVAGFMKNGTFPLIGVDDQLFNGTWGLSLVVMNSLGTDVMFSGVLKGSGKEGFSTGCSSIYVVSQREVWFAGYTKYSGFPTTEDAFDRTFNNEDGYFMMIDPMSGSLNYSSFFGGSSEDSIYEILMTSQGEIICAGSTYSANFPTMNALQPEKPGDRDGFVFKLILTETTSTTSSSTSTTTPTSTSTYTPTDMIYVALAGVSLGVIALVIVVAVIRNRRPS